MAKDYEGKTLKVGDHLGWFNFGGGGNHGTITKIIDDNHVEVKDVDGHIYPISLTSERYILSNSRACNAVSPELRMATRLRLKEDFKDNYGSYRKGEVFWVYPHGFSPHHATLRVPGREVTLDVPWDKVELANAKACNSTNPVVRKAMNACGTPKNSAYTDFGLFKDYKTYAATELTAFLQKFGEVAEELKKQATISKRGTDKPSEQEYIDACLARCQTALKEARDRIQRQTQNVMQ